MSLTARTLTGPLPGVTGGTMHAQLTATLHNPAGVLAGTAIGPRIDAAIGMGGTFSLALYANDDTANHTHGTAWRITGELITATGLYSYAAEAIQLSINDPSSVALGNLTPAQSSPAYYTYATAAALAAQLTRRGALADRPDPATVTVGTLYSCDDVPAVFIATDPPNWTRLAAGIYLVNDDQGPEITLDDSNLTAQDPTAGSADHALRTVLTNLWTAITARLVKANNLSDLPNAATARANLQLGTAALTDTGTGAGNTILGDNAALTNSRPPTGSAGGDLSSTYPNPTVVKMQGRAISDTAPTGGYVMAWNAASSQWEPTAISSSDSRITGTGGLALGTYAVTVPGAGTLARTDANNAFSATQTFNGDANFGNVNVFAQAYIYTNSNNLAASQIYVSRDLTAHGLAQTAQWVRGGTGGAGDGLSQLWILPSSVGGAVGAAQSEAAWADATAATATSYVQERVVTGGGALTAVARRDGGGGANTTGLWLWDSDAGSLKRVLLGAADSGGVGYRMLRITN